MNPSVLTQFGTPDPNASPLNIVQLVALLNQLVSSQIQGSYIPYIIQNATPNVEDQDKAWMFVDASGRPIETRIFYNGSWRRIYNGMLGEVRMYQGDPTTDFDSTGLGLVGGRFDGWALCNGSNGTADLSDHFIAAANMNQPGNGYNSGHWQSKITGVLANTGGNNQIILNANTTYRAPYPATFDPSRQQMDRYHASGDGNDAGGDLWGINSVQHQVIVPQDAGNTTPDPIPSVNPFISLGFITFVGYAA